MSESADPLDWEVFDMMHEHRYCLNDSHGSEWGPMTKAQALEMQSRNPRAHWARRIPRKVPVSS